MMCWFGVSTLVLWVLAVAADNLALLSGTLKTYQRAACDDQVVTLRCPHGTCISVQVAQYGKSAPELAALCPDHTNRHAVSSNTTCLWPNALQYSLLQTVVEACQKKRQCKFQTSPKTFGGDPCPGVRKYVEIAYKCRPYEFRSKVACENDVMQLHCNPNSRIAIYSASFGRTEYESISCPQPQGVREETCLVSYATETVMQLCHGKRQCTLTANAATFGNPCHMHSRMYLKVVFTCVPRSVLQEKYEEHADEDETLEPEEDLENYDTLEDALRESDVFSASPNLAVPGGRHAQNLTKVPRLSASQAPPSLQTEDNSQENREKMLLYLIVSVSGGLLSILGLLIGRLLWQRHKVHATNATTTLPNFSDDLSEIDADIDLTPATITIVSSPHLPGEVVRFGGDANAPRSLSRSGNNHQYYYG